MRIVDDPGAFARSPLPPWQQSAGLGTVLEGWARDASLRDCFVLDERLAAREPDMRPIPEALHPAVRSALELRGLRELYSHQAECFELARLQKSFVIATPTASGKSLCYNLPVLDCFARDAEARALYLFPTKALSRDQEESLRALMKDAGLSHGAITFDGDTPADARRSAKERSGIILTNPDMLHKGVLPHHANWARLFSRLRYVIIDELHTYCGVFGSHLANVLRRLDRVAKFHGSSPTFIFASATIANPREHAALMLGREVELVGQSGAPSGSKRVMVYNPPVVNKELGIRASYLKSAVRLTADLVRRNVPTLLFGQSRNSVEVMLKYLRDHLANEKIDPSRIMGYRGGYLPAMRRGIEAQLRSGEILCVVATNALELGIDIGSLDAVVCAGYPGSMAALWQRFGRAGRRQGESLSLLVTSSAPLDQYIAADSKNLVGSPIEHARIDPDNVEILIQHLKCAAFELPFEEGEGFREVSEAATGEALSFLARHEVVHQSPGANGKQTFHWSTEGYPANHVSLRSVGWDNVVIIDCKTNKTLAEMDWRSAHTMLHEQAIYQHDAEQFQVERLDLDNHKAFVRWVEPDYFTDAMTYTRVEVIEQSQSRPAGSDALAASFGAGDVSVVSKVVGYKKIKFHTHENVGYGEVALPEMQMHTSAFWLTVSDDLIDTMPLARPAVIDALRAMATALHTVACVGLMIDPRDLGRTVGSRGEPDGVPRQGQVLFDPTIFLYDQMPGGVGLSPRLFEQRGDVLRRGRRLLERCECDDGCPACIGPNPPAIGPTALRRKPLVLRIFDLLGVTALQ